jgi:hypothetical protein
LVAVCFTAKSSQCLPGACTAQFAGGLSAVLWGASMCRYAAQLWNALCDDQGLRCSELHVKGLVHSAHTSCGWQPAEYHPCHEQVRGHVVGPPCSCTTLASVDSLRQRYTPLLTYMDSICCWCLGCLGGTAERLTMRNSAHA